MLSVPTPTPEETRANATFEALLWALSRPGQVKALPEPGETLVIEALIDRECRVHSADPALLPRVMQTGAEVAEIDQADHVFLGSLRDADVLKSLSMGSDLYPDDGATVVVRAQFGTGQRLRLTGPGIEGQVELRVSGLPEGFWETRSAVMRYPMGFEIFLIDGADVLGIPRSTQVEVL